MTLPMAGQDLNQDFGEVGPWIDDHSHDPSPLCSCLEDTEIVHSLPAELGFQPHLPACWFLFVSQAIGFALACPGSPAADFLPPPSPLPELPPQ